MTEQQVAALVKCIVGLSVSYAVALAHQEVVGALDELRTCLVVPADDVSEVAFAGLVDVGTTWVSFYACIGLRMHGLHDAAHI